MDEKNLGEKIRERRKLLKLTQGQLAKAMLVSTDYISRIEKGERTPSDRVRIDLDDFLAGRGRFAELGTGKEKAAESGGKSSGEFSAVVQRVVQDATQSDDPPGKGVIGILTRSADKRYLYSYELMSNAIHGGSVPTGADNRANWETQQPALEYLLSRLK